MKTVLVTGGAGFIGSHFVKHLFDQWPDTRIVVLDSFTYAANPDNIPDRIRDSSRFRLVKGDIKNRFLVEEIVSESELVVHFAAESHVTRSLVDDLPFFETDVIGTQTISAAISRHASRVEKFVHISTSEVYGTALSGPMNEDHPLNPCTPYAAAKAGADRLVHAYWETYKIPTVILRPFNNYGSHQHPEKAVPRFITAALMGRPITVHGSGLMTRDWLFVEDTCRAVLRVLDSNLPGGQVFNLGTGVDESVIKIAHTVCDLVGVSHDLIQYVNSRPGQVDRHISDSSKITKMLGWKPEIDLEEGLKRTVDWYKANPTWWESYLDNCHVKADGTRGITGSY